MSLPRDRLPGLFRISYRNEQHLEVAGHSYNRTWSLPLFLTTSLALSDFLPVRGEVYYFSSLSCPCLSTVICVCPRWGNSTVSWRLLLRGGVVSRRRRLAIAPCASRGKGRRAITPARWW